jgi:NAD(P)-dependent dehydrogenase (short-subunit alcohol dehydrogenase family)
MRFEGKVVAITGGGSGIGREVAARFVSEGASVIINGRDKAKLDAAVEAIDKTGQRVGVLPGT